MKRVRYRRAELSRLEEVGSLAVSVVVGASAAAAAFYLTRLLLAREPIGGTVADPRERLTSGNEHED